MSTASEAAPLLRSPGALVAVLCITSVLGMLGFSSFPALLPEFQRDWGLSNTEAGWISGIFYACYVVAVPLLVGSTDRVDPRRIYLLPFLISAAAALGYALLADGFWSALSFRALAGVGLAGGYMPGLKLLTDRVGGPRRSRYVAFYTAGFSLGTAFSFAFTGEAAAWLGWRGAFAAAALGGLVAFVLVPLLLRPATAAEMGEAQARHTLHFRPVVGNRAPMAFIPGYTGHTSELFAPRSRAAPPPPPRPASAAPRSRCIRSWDSPARSSVRSRSAPCSISPAVRPAGSPGASPSSPWARDRRRRSSPSAGSSRLLKKSLAVRD